MRYMFEELAARELFVDFFIVVFLQFVLIFFNPKLYNHKVFMTNLTTYLLDHSILV